VVVRMSPSVMPSAFVNAGIRAARPVIVLPDAGRIVELHEVGIRDRCPVTHVYPGEHTRLDRPSLHAGLDFVLCREAAAEP